MELRQNPSGPNPSGPNPPGPSLRGLMTGLLNVSRPVLVTLLATSIGLYVIASQGMPLLAWIIFSVVWGATLVAVLGVVAEKMTERRHRTYAH
ncbi:hypothetical protein [Kitasatospora sp. McL0602]|uniref:hypothetical protein n=1 Tax=Kitasatospora sp. McL0602 TaxID=3439530 RepID=UPI003F8ABC68